MLAAEHQQFRAMLRARCDTGTVVFLSTGPVLVRESMSPLVDTHERFRVVVRAARVNWLATAVRSPPAVRKLAG